VADETFDHLDVAKQAYEDLRREDYSAGLEKLLQVIAYYEGVDATHYTEYLTYLYDLHFVYINLNEPQRAIDTLRKLTIYLQNNADPLQLKPDALQIYVQSWVRLALLYKQVQDRPAAANTFNQCIPVFIQLFGADSPEVATANEYLASV
jgi:tetratricopeptide (TPR) repeat protein